MKQFLFLLALLAQPAAARELRVCADPNNMPFSNEAQQGFENRIVQLVAGDLHADVRYVWWAQRRGNVRSTLNAGLCDLIPGVASGLEMLATTRPYYRSTYVVLSKAGALSDVTSFDDPRLQKARIGVQLIGDDFANIPPAHALSNRGIVDNVRGYPIYGDYNRPDPQRGIIDALARGELDLAYAWGPTAGYFAKHAAVSIGMRPVTPQIDGPSLPMVFDVSMGLRKDDIALRREVEQSLSRHAADIRAILTGYGVPLVD